MVVCTACRHENPDDADVCGRCAHTLVLGTLTVFTGGGEPRAYALKGRPMVIGRATESDVVLADRSVSRQHARLTWENGGFVIEDLGSRYGVLVDAARVQRSAVASGTQIRICDSVLELALSNDDRNQTRPRMKAENTDILLSVLQGISSTLVLSTVLSELTDAVLRITKAERSLLFLVDPPGLPADSAALEPVPGLRLRVARGKSRETPPGTDGLSTSVLKQVRETGLSVATGDAAQDPKLGKFDSVAGLGLRTIVCVPLLAASAEATGRSEVVGVVWTDNPTRSSGFAPETIRAVEALGRHAGLAIRNAELYELQQRTLAELRAARDAAEEASRAKSAFLLLMSNELHTPLGAVLGYSDMCAERAAEKGDAEQLADLQRIRESGQKLLQMVDEVLDLARLEGQRLELHAQPLDASRLLRAAAQEGAPLARAHGSRFEVDVPDDLGTLRVDGERVQRVLVALLASAGHRTRDGEVTLSARREDGALVCTVADTSTGLTPGQARAIFEPFAGGHEALRLPGGLGQGLAVSRRLCEAMGGTLDVTSTPGAGARFTVRLPWSD